MSAGARILETLQRQGITCRREADSLALRPATGTVPADLIELARAHKAELLEALPDTATTAVLRATLYRLANAEGLPRAIVDRLTDADLHPDSGAGLLTDEGLRRWLHALAENERMREGIPPDGWTQASYCHHCGPVKLWEGAPLHVLGCPWCHVRRAGGIVPRPLLACASCTRHQQQPNTSEAGMHGCAKGHGMHYARAQHVCADWRPLGSPP